MTISNELVILVAKAFVAFGLAFTRKPDIVGTTDIAWSRDIVGTIASWILLLFLIDQEMLAISMASWLFLYLLVTQDIAGILLLVLAKELAILRAGCYC